MADVNRLQQRPRPMRDSHALVAQTDWAYDHQQQNQHQTQYQNDRRHPRQPAFHLRQGPRRSRDASIVRLDPTRHVAQSATYESTDSAEESDISENAFTSFESVARLVRIAEVSPSITQVPGYDPPALLHVSPERPPVPDGFQPAAIDHFYPQPEASFALPRYHPNESFEGESSPRSGDPCPPLRQITTHAYQGRNDTVTSTRSQRGQNPTAVSFAPRVHYGDALREGSHHRSNIASVYRREGNARTRPSTSRNYNMGRAEANHQTRPRPMPRPRGTSMRGRPSIRGARRPGGHIRPPTVSSTETVRDRYPIFPSMPAQSGPSRPLNPIPPRSGSIAHRRGIRSLPLEARTSQLHCSQPRYPSTTESQPSVRSRASSNSLSTPNLSSAFEQPLVRGRMDFEVWDDNPAPTPHYGSVRSSRTKSEFPSTSRFERGRCVGLHTELPFANQSPLDLLTQEFRRLSTGIPARSQTSFKRTPRAPSTDGRFLSANAFCSSSDDEIEEKDFRFWDRSDRRGSSHVDGYYSTDGRNNEPSHQPRHHIGIAARIADVEADCQSGTIRPPSLSPSTQSASSISVIDSSILNASQTEEELPSHCPVTPGRQLVSCARTAFTSQSAVRSQATPRVRVYDERKPVGTQPQTPADVNRKSRTTVNPESLMPGSCQTVRPFARALPAEQSLMIPPCNAHRDTYSALQQTNSQSHATSSQPSSPYSPNLDLRTAAAVSAVERRRTARGSTNENVIDPSANGMETERDTWVRRREEASADTMDHTPPREGRYEQYMS